MGGIYIHIPFCRQACHYCNFHFSTSLKNKDELILAIISEIKERRVFFEDRNIQSLYIGGGTPSLLSQKEIGAIFSALHDVFNIDPGIETTLEANPEDINLEKLDYWHDLGINRLSVGIQSFQNEDLKFMNRAHNAHQGIKALELCKASKISNITADLMFGLIGNNLETWKSNLEMMNSFDLNHLSIYNLTIEEQTVFANWKMKNKIQETASEGQEQQFFYASEYLEKNGYKHYEISNYAKPEKMAVHNSNYWNRIPYLGIGPSAHSFDGKARSWNIANNNRYIKESNSMTRTREHEILHSHEHYNELIMLGLRRRKGIAFYEINKLEDSIKDHFDKVSGPLIHQGILMKNEENIMLSHKNWYVSDQIASELFLTH